MSTTDNIIDFLNDERVPRATKQVMSDSGLNVFGFDLAMESFNRVKTDRAAVYKIIPEVFVYEHENGLLVFVKLPNDDAPTVEVTQRIPGHLT
jgi:hypothetical protein